MVASLFSNIEMVNTLVAAAGADVNIKTDKDDTALTIAAYNGHINAIRALIAAGADVNIANKNGETALMIARDRGYYEITRRCCRTK